MFFQLQQMFFKFAIRYTVFQIVAIISHDYIPASPVDMAVYKIAKKRSLWLNWNKQKVVNCKFKKFVYWIANLKEQML